MRSSPVFVWEGEIQVLFFKLACVTMFRGMKLEGLMRRCIVVGVVLFLLLQSRVSYANQIDYDERYQVGVALWHAYEDKESMGNSGLEKKADLLLSGDRMYIFLEMKTLTVGNLTTSVSRFFYLESSGKFYRSAEPYAVDLEIPNDSEKRPRVFSFPLEEKKEFYEVLVDPRVAEMGADPINARLKVDWSTMTKTENDIDGPALLAKRAAVDRNPLSEVTIQGIRIQDEKGLKGNINVSLASRSTLEKEGLILEIKDQVKGYYIHAIEPITEIPADYDTGNPMIAKEVELDSGASILFTESEEITNILCKSGDAFREVEFEKTTEGYLVKNAKYGMYALVKKSVAAAEAADDNMPVASAASLPQAVKPIKSEKPLKEKQMGNIHQEHNSQGGSKEQSAHINENILSPERLDSSVSGENRALKAKEHTGIILSILGGYLLLTGIAIYVWVKVYPYLSKERERSRYLLMYSLKGGEDHS